MINILIIPYRFLANKGIENLLKSFAVYFYRFERGITDFEQYLEANRKMEAEPPLPRAGQPFLFEWGEASSGTLELYPEVWNAVEALASPDPSARQVGLAQLQNLGAARLSPLAAYLLATRLTDSDIELRGQIIQVLAEVLNRDETGRPAPDSVRQALTGQLSRMRTREIYALLQAITHQANLAGAVARLLNACPRAGNHLAWILSERKIPIPIRLEAARQIGKVGYIDTIPALERLALRLETRLSGQQAWSFAANSTVDETVLLPHVQAALTSLRLP
jgi:hypothetical protein